MQHRQRAISLAPTPNDTFQPAQPGRRPLRQRERGFSMVPTELRALGATLEVRVSVAATYAIPPLDFSKLPNYSGPPVQAAVAARPAPVPHAAVDAKPPAVAHRSRSPAVARPQPPSYVAKKSLRHMAPAYKGPSGDTMSAAAIAWEQLRSIGRRPEPSPWQAAAAPLRNESSMAARPAAPAGARPLPAPRAKSASAPQHAPAYANPIREITREQRPAAVPRGPWR